MNTLEMLALMIIVVVLLVWRISWLASRVHRADTRADRAWSALDAALVVRAQRAAELVMTPGIDPATALLVLDAAAAALVPDLCRGERERAESDLSHRTGYGRSDDSCQPPRAGLGAGASQDLPPIAQRCRRNSPVAPPPIHRTNLAAGGAYSRSASV